MKPKLFVASSSESEELATAIQANLGDHADVTPWNRGAFEPSRHFMENLIDLAKQSDFSAFVLSADDVVTLRNKEYAAARDNVILELGLFIGTLGMERCFFLVPEGPDNFRLPSDLAGVNHLEFQADRDDGNLRAALAPASEDIRQMMVKHDIMPERRAADTLFSKLAGEWDLEYYWSDGGKGKETFVLDEAGNYLITDSGFLFKLVNAEHDAGTREVFFSKQITAGPRTGQTHESERLFLEPDERSMHGFSLADGHQLKYTRRSRGSGSGV